MSFDLDCIVSCIGIGSIGIVFLVGFVPAFPSPAAADLDGSMRGP